MLYLFPASWEGTSPLGFQTIKTKAAIAAFAHVFFCLFWFGLVFLHTFLKIQGLMGHKVILFFMSVPTLTAPITFKLIVQNSRGQSLWKNKHLGKGKIQIHAPGKRNVGRV